MYPWYSIHLALAWEGDRIRCSRVSFLDALESFLNRGCLSAAWRCYFTDHYKNGESLLVRPVTPAPWPSIRGGRGVCVVGVIHPWGIGIPCRFVSRSRPTTILKHGGLSQSVTITTVGMAIPCHAHFLSNFFGGIFWIIYKIWILFESCWWLWFSLGSLWQQIDKRRGRAHPQCWWCGNQMKWATPATVATIGRQKLGDGFGSSQLAFGTSWCFRLETTPWHCW